MEGEGALAGLKIEKRMIFQKGLYTEFIHSVSLYLLFPAIVNFISFKYYMICY